MSAEGSGMTAGPSYVVPSAWKEAPDDFAEPLSGLLV